MSLSARIPDIRPISDLRTHLADIEQAAKDSGEPIILTRNGSPSLVLIDSAAYDAQLQHQRAVLKLREAELEEHRSILILDNFFFDAELWVFLKQFDAGRAEAGAKNEIGRTIVPNIESITRQLSAERGGLLDIAGESRGC